MNSTDKTNTWAHRRSQRYWCWVLISRKRTMLSFDVVWKSLDWKYVCKSLRFIKHSFTFSLYIREMSEHVKGIKLSNYPASPKMKTVIGYTKVPGFSVALWSVYVFVLSTNKQGLEYQKRLLKQASIFLFLRFYILCFHFLETK